MEEKDDRIEVRNEKGTELRKEEYKEVRKEGRN